MVKKKTKVYVGKASDGTYWCHVDMPNGVVTGAGSNVEAAKNDFLLAYEETRNWQKEDGEEPLPEVDFTYQYDLQSFFEFFSYLNASEIARRAGISPLLMRQYTCGAKQAGEKTYEKLAKCINQIKLDLLSVSF